MKTLAALERSTGWCSATRRPRMKVIDVVQPDIYAKGHESRRERRRDENIAASARPSSATRAGSATSASRLLLDQARQSTWARCPTRRVTSLALPRDTPRRRGRSSSTACAICASSLASSIVGRGHHLPDAGITARTRAFARWLDTQSSWGGWSGRAPPVDLRRHVTLAGIAGEGKPSPRRARGQRRPRSSGVRGRPSRRTVVKQRYVLRNKVRPAARQGLLGQALTTRRAGAGPPAPGSQRLSALMAEHDMVIVNDLRARPARSRDDGAPADEAPYRRSMSVQQLELGYNLISRYRRADTFTLDENELGWPWASRRRHAAAAQARSVPTGVEPRLADARRERLSIDRALELDHSPALTLHVVDTIGAGDVLRTASMAARLDAPPAVGSLFAAWPGRSPSASPRTPRGDRTSLLKFGQRS